MKINTNQWNMVRYSVAAPIYDYTVRILEPYRSQSIALLDLKPGERVLLVGAGTGADLPYFPEGVEIVATDLTPGMIQRLEARARTLGRPVTCRVMDGQALDLPDESFDAVVLHLILSVIPDPLACIREVYRVLKPGGRVMVLDKFLDDQAKLSWARRALNLFTNLMFSDINRRLREIVAVTPLTQGREIRLDHPLLLARLGYKIVLLAKNKEERCAKVEAFELASSQRV
jgi:ubiquinone/menaquinone biosynthesis C-methylase UbiE